MRAAHYAPRAAVLACVRVALWGARNGMWWLTAGASNDDGRAR